MRKTMLAALGAATMLFAAPAAAQDFPVTGGDYWTVGEITIDDGHFGDYADHLAGLYRKSVDFQKSKGWIKASYILANVNKRAGEPDLYLVTIADRPTTPAEDEQRAKEPTPICSPAPGRATRRAAHGPSTATLAAACSCRNRSTGSLNGVRKSRTTRRRISGVARPSGTIAGSMPRSLRPTKTGTTL